MTSGFDNADEASGTVYVNDDNYAVLSSGIYSGFRFQNVTVPAGATITSATLTLYSSGSGTASYNVNIHAHDTDSASAFSSSSNNISGRTRTSAAVNWSEPSQSFSHGQQLTSPNIATVIQEVVDRGGWSSGNALALVLTPVSGGKGIFTHYTSAQSTDPALSISYTTGGGSTVLLVIAGSSPGTHEAARKAQFESWGYTVNTIQDSDSQANFDTAVAAADVVYVSGSIQPWDLLYKLREASIGVISEAPDLDTEFGFADNDGYAESETQILNVDNSHPVTTGLANGTVTVVSGSQPMAPNGNTLAAGMTLLGERSFGQLALGVIDTNGALANSHNGNATANGRRVRMPWGNISWSALNSNGLLIVQNALDWASGGSSSGLVAQWKLDESSGTTATDDSGNGHDGTLVNGPSWSTGAPRNGGLHFNSSGSGDRVDAGTFDVSGSAITLAAWVYVETASNDARLVEKSSGNTQSDQSWGLTVDENGNADFRVNAGGTWDRVEQAAIIQDGQWHHLLGTYDGTTMTLYVDGVLVNTKAHAVGGAIDTDSGKTVTLGDSPVGGRPLYGRLDDVRVYDYDLSEYEIAEVYGLIAHWKLDESTGATAVDSSLAGNDATRTGTEAWTDGVDAGGHDFDHTDGEEYFQAPNNSALDDCQEGDYTVMAYFRPSSIPPGSGSDNDAAYGIISKSGYHMGLAYRSDQLFQMEHWTASGPTWSGIATWGTTYAPGRFYHVAGVVSVTDGTVKIYVDGQLVQTANFTPGEATREYGSEPWRVGTRNPGASTWSHAPDGVIDDVRIYNRALTDEELAAFDGSSLLAHWSFDEGTGTAVADSSGNGHDASFNAGTPAWIDGIRGGALEFDGASSAATSGNFDPPAEGCVAFWIRCDAVPAARQRPFGLSNTFESFQDPDGLLRFDMNWSGAPDTLHPTQPFSFQSRWRHVVVNFRSATDEYEVYFDGQLDISGVYPADLTKQAAAVMTLGNRTGTTSFFTGALDDLRIYNYWLRPAEVADLYGLVGHWKMDEGSGSTVADSSGVGNDATLSGATWSTDCHGNPGLAFDGVGDTAATTASFDPPDVGAVAFWFQSKGEVPSRQRPWGVGSDYEMWIDPDGLLSCDVSTDGYQGGFITTDRVDDEDRWHHIVAQYDSNDDTYAIYLNGELHKSGVSTWNIQDQAANTLTFGTRTGSSENWEGEMRDFRIYNRHLENWEIANLSGIIARWNFEEFSGTTAADDGVLANDANYVGSPTLGVNGPFVANTGAAVEVNGSSDYVDSGQSLLNDLEQFTVMGWIRPDSTTPQISFFGQNDLIEVGVNVGSTTITLWTNNGGSIVATVPLPLGKWSHVAAVGDGSGLKLYFNGVEAASGGSATANYGTSTYSFKIGEGVFNASGDYFNGRFDDVRAYRRAMCPEEVYRTYRGGRPAGVSIRRWVEVR